MGHTLTFSKTEAKKLISHLQNYPTLPTPSKYEEARFQVGETIVTFYTSGKCVIQGKNSLNENAVKEKLISFLGKESDELVFGIDETGRGEKTGPLIVSGVLGWRNALRGLRDSKKTQNISAKFKEATEKSLVQANVSINPKMIDALRNKGVNMNQMELIIAKHLHALAQELEPNAITIMDGKPLGKSAKGIVFLEKGDDLEPSIGAASVIAKHLRNESGNSEKRKTWKEKEK